VSVKDFTDEDNRVLGSAFDGLVRTELNRVPVDASQFLAEHMESVQTQVDALSREAKERVDASLQASSHMVGLTTKGFLLWLTLLTLVVTAIAFAASLRPIH